MPSNYKTPGVFIEEVSVFPPSVAPVATAIPAFIGYTAYATKNGESILNVPTKIGSFVEYQEYYGDAPERKVIIRLNAQNQFVKTERQTSVKEFYLFDAMRLFYDNGGGDCYIVSVGSYNDEPSKDKIIGGLNELEKFDEPTIILSPDAVLLAEGMYDYQQQALAHCAKLQNRFFVGDLLKNDETVKENTFDDRVAQIRDKIGINNLKYGALYAPYLKTTLSANLRFRDVWFARVGGDTPSQDNSNSLLIGLTFDQGIIKLINNLSLAKKQVDEIGESTSLQGTLLKAIDEYNIFISKFKDSTPSESTTNTGDEVAAEDSTPSESTTNTGDEVAAEGTTPSESTTNTGDEAVPESTTSLDWNNIKDKSGINKVYEQIFTILKRIKTSYDELPKQPTSDYKLKEDIESLFKPQEGVLRNLLTHQREIFKASSQAVTLFPIEDFTGVRLLFGIEGDASKENLTGGIASVVEISKKYSTIEGENPNRQRIELAADAAKSAAIEFTTLFNSILTSVKNYELTFDDALKNSFGTYKSLLARADQELMVLPPSAAIAGAYTRVDNERGVWKAPANVSLNSVSGPYVNISAKEQENLNVDVTAGKSINVIRKFTGKGVLVWGARTLAGNDNEWRYLPVRRFFIFAEESIKKATEQFVFEPNDANTWVRVRAMIENFLTLQWRDGALTGAKPSQAFFVKIGLGETMTPIDILEGRMIVEIGMAVVRPAEFIILRFSHKMQEA